MTSRRDNKTKSSIYKKFNQLMLILVIATILLTAVIMGLNINHIVERVSINYAKMYSQEIVNAVESHLSREIALVSKMSMTPEVAAWLAHEQETSSKEPALEKFKSFAEILHDANIFIAIDRSKQFYYYDREHTVKTFVPEGQLSKENASDQWYFELLKSDDSYMLNADTDRFLDELRIWVNSKVMLDGEVVGVVGTGLYLAPFIEDIFKARNDDNAKTVIINRSGAIQLDSDVQNISENHFDAQTDKIHSIERFTNDEIFTTQVKAFMASQEEDDVFNIREGQYDLAAVSKIHETSWYVITFYSKSALINFNNWHFLILLSIITTLMMAAIINIAVGQIFMKPFRKLTESIKYREIYHDEHIYGIDRNDEFGQLATLIEDLGERLIHSTPVGMFLLDEQNVFVYTNQYFLNQFSCPTLEDFQQRFSSSPELLFAFYEDFARVKELFESSDDNWAFEAQLINFHNEPFWAEVHITTSRDTAARFKHQGILLNIQVKKDYEQKLINLATTDSLTGLFNRYHFNEIATDEMERSERYGGPLSMIIFDLDQFKSINDTYGHIIGDEVLSETAKIVKATIRNVDVLARWGGEEFSILLPGTSSEGARHAAEKIRLRLESFNHHTVGKVTASFGVAQRLQNEAYTDWFKRVDDALFESKSNGRNRVTVSDKDQNYKVNLMKLTWQDSFNSGNTLIDHQHKELFDLANKLIQYEFSRESEEVLYILFDDLCNHFITHTQTEEELLKTISYPDEDIEKHHLEHLQLIEKLSQMRASVIESPTEVFMLLIQNVIIDHMMVEDVKFFPTSRAYTERMYALYGHL